MKKRTWIKQPENTELCGQIAVAVITGITLKSSIKLFGTKEGTTTKDIIKALKLLKYKCGKKLVRFTKNPPKLAIAKVKDFYHSSREWHWVVIDKDKIFDGIDGFSNGKVNWRFGQKIVSYLPIYHD